MERHVVAVDKDETLTYEKNGLFRRTVNVHQGAREFLERQRTAGRECVLVSNASKSLEHDVASIRALFADVYMREKIEGRFMYIKEDGSLGYILDDFEGKVGTLLARLRPHEYGIVLDMSLPQIWEQLLVHKETGRPFMYADRYQNPHNRIGYRGDGAESHNFNKDLSLVRSGLMARNKAEAAELKMVMIGDKKELTMSAGSDPKTPVVVVDDKGKWLGRADTELLLNFLFDRNASPSAKFDEVAAAGTPIRLPLDKSVLAGLIYAGDLILFVRQSIARVGDKEFVFLRGGDVGMTKHMRAIIEDSGTALEGPFGRLA